MKDKGLKTFSDTKTVTNMSIDFEDNCTAESSKDVEIYWNCGKLMDCINFHLRMGMTSQRYSFFEVSNSSSDFRSGSEISTDFSHQCVGGHLRHFSEWQQSNCTLTNDCNSCCL